MAQEQKCVSTATKQQEVFTAMIAAKKGQGSFADAVITALGARRGCSQTLTFDQKALRLPVSSFLDLVEAEFLIPVLQKHAE